MPRNRRRKMLSGELSDVSKIFYLEIIDATFSVDGVLGAFAFTMAVPLIIIGNGIGALIVREITVKNVDSIRNYRFLKNGAMYSIFCLGIIMILDSFGFEIPGFVSPVITFGVVGYFLYKSIRAGQPGRYRLRTGDTATLCRGCQTFTAIHRTGYDRRRGGTDRRLGFFHRTSSYLPGRYCFRSFPTGQTSNTRLNQVNKKKN